MGVYPALADMLMERANALAEENKDIEVQVKARRSRLKELEANGLEVSDEEMNRLIALFQSGQGDRFALSDRIKSLVERIDFKSDGTQIPDYVDADIAAVIDKSPSFRITLKNGDVRAVLVDRADYQTILQSLVVGEGKRKEHLFRGQELDVSGDLIDQVK